jgi:hypothetical protein
MTRVLAAVSLLCVFGLGAGCGPVRSTAFLLDADINIQAAKTAGAERYSPYEWTSANLYLKKAREEVGYSDFETAVTFAQKASEFANKARENAMAASKRDDAQAPTP